MIEAAKNALIQAFGPTPPDVCVILGSGLGAFADRISGPIRLSYDQIPSFPKPTIAGHVGECVYGSVGPRKVLVFRGRFHFYEGHPLSIVTLPVRAVGAWGTKALVVTNAAGGLRKDVAPGSLMLLKDHVNLLGENPLRGPNLEFGPRFLDMTAAYDDEFRAHAKDLGRRLKIPLPEGTYAAMLGPSYETPAEIKMLSIVGVDAVGMSTVPEVIVARHHGMRVLGISCITNLAAGTLGPSQKINHEEVLENTQRAQESFCELLTQWIESAPLE